MAFRNHAGWLSVFPTENVEMTVAFICQHEVSAMVGSSSCTVYTLRERVAETSSAQTNMPCCASKCSVGHDLLPGWGPELGGGQTAGTVSVYSLAV